MESCYAYKSAGGPGFKAFVEHILCLTPSINNHDSRLAPPG
jgi:hypothetical protein